MKGYRNTIAAVTLGAVSLCGVGDAANAGSEILPGITTGLAIGQPLPEGVYAITIPTWGSRSTQPTTDVGALIPVWVVWSTPWTILGGRVGFNAVTPVAQVSIDSPVGLNKANWTNALLEATLKWDLGNGFNFGVHEDVWLPVANSLSAIGVAYDFASFMQAASLSYVKDGWNLTATGIFGMGKNGTKPGDFNANWANLDLTGTKTFGKWEIGAIAFGSSDLTSPHPNYLKVSQFAVGGLVGYNFGPVITQLKLSRDVYEKNYGGYDTRLWANIIIPVWIAPSPTAVSSKY